uniref:Uncharacterized protein n=1 Tax=Hanusia phi TaxID=3032 RepID=A0A7S0F0R5_9CRYP|mmetsp:Transcript_34523/g.77849  ORF Transcript_34523/g.77849 Transcript_34523/m.77849 type:complete len:584 (+) Transcript_34523:42-1793(+)
MIPLLSLQQLSQNRQESTAMAMNSLLPLTYAGGGIVCLTPDSIPLQVVPISFLAQPGLTSKADDRFSSVREPMWMSQVPMVLMDAGGNFLMEQDKRVKSFGSEGRFTMAAEVPLAKAETIGQDMNAIEIPDLKELVKSVSKDPSTSVVLSRDQYSKPIISTPQYRTSSTAGMDLVQYLNHCSQTQNNIEALRLKAVQIFHEKQGKKGSLSPQTAISTTPMSHNAPSFASFLCNGNVNISSSEGVFEKYESKKQDRVSVECSYCSRTFVSMHALDVHLSRNPACKSKRDASVRTSISSQVVPVGPSSGAIKGGHLKLNVEDTHEFMEISRSYDKTNDLPKLAEMKGANESPQEKLPGTKSILQTLAHFAESLAASPMIGKSGEQLPSMLPLKRKSSDCEISGLDSRVAHDPDNNSASAHLDEDGADDTREGASPNVLKKKRTRLPPMASMTRFEEVVLDFPFDVRAALARIQSPAAFFSTCSLDIFKRHMKFGKLGGTIIKNYFTLPSESFEPMMHNPVKIPEFDDFGVSVGSADYQELKVFNRMLLCKKRFLDINRRAVSKRSKMKKSLDKNQNIKNPDEDGN